MKIVIELDGGQHGEQRNIQYDIERTKYIESCGYRVFRYWNNEVNENMEGILEELMDIVRNADSVKNLTLTLSQGRGDQPLE
jgi:crossover junction endodeoxyribonuclease RuvC